MPCWTVPSGRQLGLGLRMGWLGSLLMGLYARPFSYWPVLVQGQGGTLRGLLLPWVAITGGGMSCIPSVPLGWIKADSGVGHSLAMWPHLWHLKHWRESRSQLLAAPSPLHLAHGSLAYHPAPCAFYPVLCG